MDGKWGWELCPKGPLVMDVLFSGWAIQIICVVQWELLVVQIELNQFAAGPVHVQLNHGLLKTRHE